MLSKASVRTGRNFPTGLGELQASRQTAKQLNAKILLQELDMPANGTFGDAKLIGSAGKALVPGRCFEGTKGIEGRKAHEKNSMA
jgi:hypothetical protein